MTVLREAAREIDSHPLLDVDQNLLIAGFLAGIILILMGILKLGLLIKFIPRPVTIGFTSGIAVIIFSGQKDHKDEAIMTAQKFIEKNTRSRITVGQLASLVCLGRRNLERRFKKATGNSVMEYIQRVKMEVVKKNLETSRLGVNEAMDRVGYSDPKAFRVIFKKVTGMSPSQYRNRYNREFVE